jgi:hypothetical protein
VNEIPDRNSDTHASAGCEPDRQEEMTAVGGCNGIYIVSCRQINDYYKAHAYAAGGGAILLGLKALGLLAS